MSDPRAIHRRTFRRQAQPRLDEAPDSEASALLATTLRPAASSISD